MIRYTATIEKFDQQGEKTGWTYINIPAAIAEKIKPNTRKSFRVKGKLDEVPIAGMALLPMGDGNFIMALNSVIRRKLGKRMGAKLNISLEEDKNAYEINSELMECLQDEPTALEYFKSLPFSHQAYFSKWIESAKTEQTRLDRISRSVNALAKGWGYPEMLRAGKS